jgi:ribosome-binding protein aMBF1 (putative translation factor)
MTFEYISGMAARSGGADRVSTKTKLASELLLLGRVLIRTREARGLKQAEVAARLGLPASYLSKIENGTRRLDAIELIRIAEAMNTDPADIVRELQQELAAARV